MIDPATWEMVDRVVQWVIIPLLAWLWVLHQQSQDTNRRVDQLEKVDIKLTTVIEEMRRASSDLRTDTRSHDAQLSQDIRDLTSRLNTLIEGMAKGGHS